ncbi:hypothetical protein CICLE_v10013273mg [Citrus x clementina]|uniref:Uncharacterized protein n=1 Tax=Citrus clementina TaxID=85681 RepID=V4SSN3_CITCL|nr:hypothetical protein CICLE_v10013273mg [Citrus x clementina]
MASFRRLQSINRVMWNMYHGISWYLVEPTMVEKGEFKELKVVMGEVRVLEYPNYSSNLLCARYLLKARYSL